MTTPHLDLPAEYLIQVRTILQTYIPEYEVWAYGSRVWGEAFAASDLDLVVRNPRHLSEPCDHIVALREAFVASNLPIRVDVVDWARIPPSFHHEIERGYVVVQPAMSTDNVRED